MMSRTKMGLEEGSSQSKLCGSTRMMFYLYIVMVIILQYEECIMTVRIHIVCSCYNYTYIL